MAVVVHIDGRVLLSDESSYVIASASGKDGNSYRVKNKGPSPVAVSAPDGQTIDGQASCTLGVGFAILLISDGENWSTFSGGESGPPSGSLPAGMVMGWAKPISQIPSGWALCDGTNGTYDMRGSFIRAAGPDEETGGTGGSATHTHDAHSALSHSGAAVGDHPAQSHTGAAVSAHAGTAVGDHAALTHTGTDVSAHTGTAVSAHAGTAVSAHAGCAVAAHTVVSSKQGSSTGNVVTTATHTVTQPNNHTVTQPDAHTVTQPSAHTVTQPAQHAVQSHSVTQPSAHTVTQPDQHAVFTHTVTQPAEHAAQAHSEAENEPVHFKLVFIQKL
jgi:hypothetical protein